MRKFKGIKVNEKEVKIIETDEYIEIRDKNDNLIYCEDSDGFWARRAYDKNNNEIYSKYSDGYWEKQKYNENNNEIYFENVYGLIIDKRNKGFFMTKQKLIEIIKSVQTINGKLSDFDCEKIADAIMEKSNEN